MYNKLPKNKIEEALKNYNDNVSSKKWDEAYNYLHFPYGTSLGPGEFDNSYKKAYEKNDYNAFINLGNCYQLGLGCDQDFDKAISCYQKSLELRANNPIALEELLKFYLFGIHVEHSPNTAFKYLEEFYIKLGSPKYRRLHPNLSRVINTLIACYIEGFGCEKNYANALEIIKKYSLGSYMDYYAESLYILCGQKYNLPNEFINYCVNESYIPALYFKGSYYLENENIVEAAIYFKKAYQAYKLDDGISDLKDEHKYKMAMFFKYNMCDFEASDRLFKDSISLIRIFDDYDISEYLPYLSFIVNTNNPMLIMAVADIYSGNHLSGIKKEIIQDKDKAIELYKLAYDILVKEEEPTEFIIECCHNIGKIYEELEEYDEAISWYEKGISYDDDFYQDGSCHIALGDIYIDPYNYEQDIDKAISYYSVGYSRGNRRAADLYFYGNIVANDYQKALYHLNKIDSEAELSLFQKGYCNLALNNYFEAKKCFELGIDLYKLDSKYCEIGLALMNVYGIDNDLEYGVSDLEDFVCSFYPGYSSYLKHNLGGYNLDSLCYKLALEALCKYYAADPLKSVLYNAAYNHYLSCFNDELLDDDF